MAKYTIDSVVESTDQFYQALESGGFTKDFVIDIEKYNDPPVLDIIRFISDLGNIDLQDRILKQCVVGKLVKIIYAGNVLFTFQLNSINDSWDAIEGFVKYPAAYMALMNLAHAYILKKYSALSSDTPNTIAPDQVEALR